MCTVLLFAQTTPPSSSVYHNQVYNLAFRYAKDLEVYPFSNPEDHVYEYDASGNLVGQDFAHSPIDLDKAEPVEQSVFGALASPAAPYGLASIITGLIVYPNTAYSSSEIKNVLAFELEEQADQIQEIPFAGGLIFLPKRLIYEIESPYIPGQKEQVSGLAVLHGTHWYKLSWYIMDPPNYEEYTEGTQTTQGTEKGVGTTTENDLLAWVNTLEINGQRLQLEVDQNGQITSHSLAPGELTTSLSTSALQSRFTAATAGLDLVPGPQSYVAGSYQRGNAHTTYWAPQHQLSLEIPADEKGPVALKSSPQSIQFHLTSDFTIVGTYAPNTSSYDDETETAIIIEGEHQFYRTPYQMGDPAQSVEITHLKADWTEERIRKFYAQRTSMMLKEDLQAFPQAGFTLYCPQQLPRMFQVLEGTLGNHSAAVLIHEGEWLHIVNLHLRYRHQSLDWLNTLTFRGQQLQLTYNNGELASAGFTKAQSAHTLTAEDQAFLQAFRTAHPAAEPLNYPKPPAAESADAEEDPANTFAYRYMEQIRKGEKPSVNTALKLELAELRLSNNRSTWEASLEHGISLTYLLKLADPACIGVDISKSFCTLEDDLGNDLMEGHIPFLYDALRQHQMGGARVAHAGWAKERQVAAEDFAHQVFAQTLVLPPAGASFLRMQGILYVKLLSDDWYTSDLRPQQVDVPQHDRGIINTNTNANDGSTVHWSTPPGSNSFDRSRADYHEFAIVGHPENFVALEILDETGEVQQTLGRNDHIRITKTKDGKVHFPAMRMTMARPQTVTLDLDEIIHLGLN